MDSGRRNTSLDLSTLTPKKKLVQLMDDVGSKVDNMGSVEYGIAVHNFRQFVATNYMAAKEHGAESAFLDDLFVSIRSQKSNTVQYLALLVALRRVDLGDKVTKADRMSKDLISIENPDAIPEVWELLFVVLIWLRKAIKSSVQLILNPLRERAWRDIGHDKSDTTRMAGFQLLEKFLRYFPSMIEN